MQIGLRMDIPGRKQSCKGPEAGLGRLEARAAGQGWGTGRPPATRSEEGLAWEQKRHLGAPGLPGPGDTGSGLASAVYPLSTQPGPQTPQAEGRGEGGSRQRCSAFCAPTRGRKKTPGASEHQEAVDAGMHPTRKEASTASPSWHHLPPLRASPGGGGAPHHPCGPLRTPFPSQSRDHLLAQPREPMTEEGTKQRKGRASQDGAQTRGSETPTAGLYPMRPPGARPASCPPPRIALTSSEPPARTPARQLPGLPHFCPWQRRLPGLRAPCMLL